MFDEKPRKNLIRLEDYIKNQPLSASVILIGSNHRSID